MDNVERHILALNSLAIEGLRTKGYTITSPLADRERSGILCFQHPQLPVEEVEARLREANVYAAIRPGGIRISPSIYNDEQDIATLLEALP